MVRLYCLCTALASTWCDASWNSCTTHKNMILIGNKMELLQSQAPAERELLGNSAVRTLDNRV